MIFPVLSQYNEIENIIRSSVLANVSSLTSTVIPRLTSDPANEFLG